MTYDLAGNQISITPGRSFNYDAENRQTSAVINSTTTTYSYDGDGRRITKNVGGAVTTYVYDAMGHLAAEYGAAQPNAPCATCYLTVDQLGSTRLVTDATGAPTRCYDYLPFGEEIGSGVNGRTGSCFGNWQYPSTPDTLSTKFTSKERDAETGLDYFGARYMSAAQGRFTSPDAINLTDERIVNPSNTLNKYIYGGNNPLKYTDPDGKDITVFYEEGYPTGHVMLAASNQQTNDFAFLSVGPQTHLDPAILSHPLEGVPGTSAFSLPQNADDLRKNFAALTIQTSPEVAQQAIDAIRNGAGTGNYAVLGNNCTSACAKVLKDIGLYPGSKGGLPWTPSKFWANLNLLYGKKRPPAFVRSILGSTIGSSPLITPSFQLGSDFGNPRFGVNTFDWLMLQLQAPMKACVTTSDSASGTSSTECH